MPLPMVSGHILLFYLIMQVLFNNMGQMQKQAFILQQQSFWNHKELSDLKTYCLYDMGHLPFPALLKWPYFL